MRQALGLIWLFTLAWLPLTGAEPAGTPTIVLIAGEYEYGSTRSLPAWKSHLESKDLFHCIYLERKGEEIPGLEALNKADLVILFARRMTLPEAQLGRIKDYVRSGKPLIGLRTASHAFENWREFDRDILGGNYQGHHGNEHPVTARVIPEAVGHPILQGVAAEFPAGGSLYRTSPLAAGATPLLLGSISHQPPEPMAFTYERRGARTFYTSLGHPQDFENASFRRLLLNAVFWALDRQPPGAALAATIPPGLRPGTPKNIDPAEFERLARTDSYVLLDVRMPQEYAAGHLEGATNIDFLAPNFASRVAALDTNRVYLIYCASGNRSGKACARMSEMKFPFLYNLTGGFKAWDAAGKKVVK